MKFERNEIVGIKQYRGDEYNYEARVNNVKETIVNDYIYYHVSNMNMPFHGTVSGFFKEDELEKI